MPEDVVCKKVLASVTGEKYILHTCPCSACRLEDKLCEKLKAAETQATKPLYPVKDAPRQTKREPVSVNELQEAMEGEFDGTGLWTVVEELLSLRKEVAHIQTCKKGHKFVAKSHEYVCPLCQLDKIREQLS